MFNLNSKHFIKKMIKITLHKIISLNIIKHQKKVNNLQLIKFFKFSSYKIVFQVCLQSSKSFKNVFTKTNQLYIVNSAVCEIIRAQV